MNVGAVDQNLAIGPVGRNTTADDMRKAATQFEALLLQQLTSALSSNGTDDESGEENLFGGDGGTGLAKQMFSEQLATTMAQSGGIGLSSLILSKFGGEQKPPTSSGSFNLSNAVTAMRDIKADSPEMPIKTRSAKAMPLIDRSAKAMPFSRPAFTGDPNDAQVISTFDDEIKADGVDPTLKNLVLDGRIVNSTRPRIAPGEPIREMVDASAMHGISPKLASAETVNYQYPVSGRLSSGFGNRFHPIDKVVKFHAGLDLAVPVGTTVSASAQGVVKFAGWDNGYGNLVVIEHPDGKETRYGHLSKLMVTANDQVSAGQPIALSGSTGKSTGPHLHFEIRENRQVVNPTKILSNVLPNTAER